MAQRISKSQSCLHFCLTEAAAAAAAHEEEKEASSSPSDNHSTTRTALRLPCGQVLRLPRRESSPADLNRYLETHPTLAKRARDLHHQSSCLSFLEERMDATATTCLNVLQGEVAHATHQQIDILLSGDATTCHVLALHSKSTTGSRLTTLAHLDECVPHCLEEMLLEHLRHHQEKETTLTSLVADAHDEVDDDDSAKTAQVHDHNDDFGFFDAVDEHEEDGGENDNDNYNHHNNNNNSQSNWLPTTSPTETFQFPGFLPAMLPHSNNNNKRQLSNIQMDLHLVGGCNERTSHKLSKDLMETWAMLADKYASQLTIHLVTAAISGLNVVSNDNLLCARGMGIETRTGRVFSLEEIPVQLQGPALEVRQARIWARAMNRCRNSLSVIHTRHTPPGELSIEAFEYQPHPHLDHLLKAQDDALLHATSTSPHLERVDLFCSSVRRTLSFLQRVPSQAVFGSAGQQPLVYTRSVGHHLNEWQRKLAGPSSSLQTSSSSSTPRLDYSSYL